MLEVTFSILEAHADEATRLLSGISVSLRQLLPGRTSLYSSSCIIPKVPLTRNPKRAGLIMRHLIMTCRLLSDQGSSETKEMITAQHNTVHE